MPDQPKQLYSTLINGTYDVIENFKCSGDATMSGSEARLSMIKDIVSLLIWPMADNMEEGFMPFSKVLASLVEHSHVVHLFTVHSSHAPGTINESTSLAVLVD